MVKYYEQKKIYISGIIIYADIFSLAIFRPIYDLGDINCICVVGDTHHGENPITNLAKWLIHSNIKTIALKQTIGQARAFEEIALKY